MQPYYTGKRDWKLFPATRLAKELGFLGYLRIEKSAKALRSSVLAHGVLCFLSMLSVIFRRCPGATLDKCLAKHRETESKGLRVASISLKDEGEQTLQELLLVVADLKDRLKYSESGVTAATVDKFVINGKLYDLWWFASEKNRVYAFPCMNEFYHVVGEPLYASIGSFAIQYPLSTTS